MSELFHSTNFAGQSLAKLNTTSCFTKQAKWSGNIFPFIIEFVKTINNFFISRSVLSAVMLGKETQGDEAQPQQVSRTEKEIMLNSGLLFVYPFGHFKWIKIYKKYLWTWGNENIARFSLSGDVAVNNLFLKTDSSNMEINVPGRLSDIKELPNRLLWSF